MNILHSFKRRRRSLLMDKQHDPATGPKKGKAPQVLGMLNKNLMRSADYTSGIIKFESGKVSMQMKRYMPASLDSIYSKYPLGNINVELLKKLPAGHPVFLYSFRFSPAMINEIFTKGRSRQIS